MQGDFGRMDFVLGEIDLERFENAENATNYLTRWPSIGIFYTDDKLNVNPRYLNQLFVCSIVACIVSVEAITEMTYSQTESSSIRQKSE
jgi:hypothetical protein